MGEETVQDFQARVAQRQQIESAVGFRDYVLDDLAYMGQATAHLEENHPELLKEKDKLSAAAEDLANKHKAILEKQKDLLASIAKIKHDQQSLEIEVQHCEETEKEGKRCEQEAIMKK